MNNNAVTERNASTKVSTKVCLYPESLCASGPRTNGPSILINPDNKLIQVHSDQRYFFGETIKDIFASLTNSTNSFKNGREIANEIYIKLGRNS
ncbi:hypothetical protein QR98_0055200 [Sarcoptes scabiei]|uniref:Uncharacterized protein n=1 Tax=Sarcoptes scabiei TaxID=52283 RepID=A0A132A7T9_SARSC|nr:hypothetical protein QR98_0055200 [Sarcoptes scabiei]